MIREIITSGDVLITAPCYESIIVKYIADECTHQNDGAWICIASVAVGDCEITSYFESGKDLSSTISATLDTVLNNASSIRDCLYTSTQVTLQ